MIVQCNICPKKCLIKPGQSGECRVRVNLDGKLVAVTYARPCAINVDPIEKKPLFHFLPGTTILSLATVGCNLHCLFCQNWEISQENPENVAAHVLEPEQVPVLAKRQGCPSVAFTYTDPTVYFEYALDSCRAARAAGLRTVLVSAGYMNPEPVKTLYAAVDAANIDLKAFSDKFYREVCDATLQPVLDTLVATKKMGVLVEVTNLIVPTLNDSDADLTNLSRWIKENMGAETPLHFSRFFPRYKMKNLPPTPEETLTRARRIAKAEGLFHVYIGNILSRDGENTSCHKCGKLLIERRGYTIQQNRLNRGHCPDCGAEVYGIWQ